MDRSRDVILISGATGQQGGATAGELLQRGYRVRAMTRKPESEAALALAARGAEVVQADLDDADSLRAALRGVWGALAIQNTWEAGVAKEEEQGKRFARLAREAGVQHYVYNSVGSADQRTGIPHFDNKWRVEEVVRSLGFPSWVIVRPVFFMENLLSPWFKPGIAEGMLAFGLAGERPLQMIAVADIGRYGLHAFASHDRMNGRAIDIAGDELTLPEAARLIGQVAGRDVRHVEVPLEEVRKASEEYALMLEWFDRVGYHADIEGNAKEFGIRPTSFEAWVQKADWSVPVNA